MLKGGRTSWDKGGVALILIGVFLIKSSRTWVVLWEHLGQYMRGCKLLKSSVTVTWPMHIPKAVWWLFTKWWLIVSCCLLVQFSILELTLVLTILLMSKCDFIHMAITRNWLCCLLNTYWIYNAGLGSWVGKEIGNMLWWWRHCPYT